jgi:hypothetical protein
VEDRIADQPLVVVEPHPRRRAGERAVLREAHVEGVEKRIRPEDQQRQQPRRKEEPRHPPVLQRVAAAGSRTAQPARCEGRLGGRGVRVGAVVVHADVS